MHPLRIHFTKTTSSDFIHSTQTWLSLSWATFARGGCDGEPCRPAWTGEQLEIPHRAAYRPSMSRIEPASNRTL
jgi:hypothetical protein